MKEYQYISIFKVLLLYIFAFIPVWFILFKKSTYFDKKTFLKRNYLLIFIEVIIFSCIYFFPKEFVMFFSSKPNIQNYMIYSLKILFVASSINVLHYTIPFYLAFNFKRTNLLLFLIKVFYIPIMIIFYLIFDIKGALFAVPLCDILYTIFLILKFKNI